MQDRRASRSARVAFQQLYFRHRCFQRLSLQRWGLPLLLAAALAASGCASNGEKAHEQLTSIRQYAWQRAEVDQATGEDASVEIEPTVVEFRNYQDPLIGFNRVVFKFNDISYRYLLIPVAKGYNRGVPIPVRKGVSNFFYNLKSPIYLINNALQLKPKQAGTNIARFGINSTIGLLGLFDPAADWFDIERAHSNFEDTFAHYGAGYGIYVVLPILGPSDLRDGTGALVEGIFHPVSYLADNPERLAIQGFDYLQDFAPQAGRYEELADQSEDPYIFFRNMYLQGVQRDAAYRDKQAE